MVARKSRACAEAYIGTPQWTKSPFLTYDNSLITEELIDERKPHGVLPCDEGADLPLGLLL